MTTDNSDRNIVIATSDGDFIIVGPLWRVIDQFLFEGWAEIVSTDLVGQWLAGLFDVNDAEDVVETRLTTAQHDPETGYMVNSIEMRTHAQISTKYVKPFFEFERDGICITGSVYLATCADCTRQGKDRTTITIVSILITTTAEYREQFADTADSTERG